MLIPRDGRFTTLTSRTRSREAAVRIAQTKKPACAGLSPLESNQSSDLMFDA